MMEQGEILVLGATGAQGSAVADALLAVGVGVRALVRNPAAPDAIALSGRGVRLCKGDFHDKESLRAALDGARGVFSVQTPPRQDDPSAEINAGRAIVETAVAAGVDVFVHTSVARAGAQETFQGWAEGRWGKDYWNSKSAVNDIVRAARFPNWVILKPAFMMDNFILPKSAWMFPELASGVLGSAMDPHARLDLIAASDVGRYAAAAFVDPARFNGEEIDLAAQSMTMADVAGTIADVTGAKIDVRHMRGHEAVAAGYSPGLVSSQRWASVEGYKVDIDKCRARGIELETFRSWAVRNRNRFGF